MELENDGIPRADHRCAEHLLVEAACAVLVLDDKQVREAHIFVQGYRPGGIARLGFSPEACAEIRPGIIAVSLSAYGHAGPWAERR